MCVCTHVCVRGVWTIVSGCLQRLEDSIEFSGAALTGVSGQEGFWRLKPDTLQEHQVLLKFEPSPWPFKANVLVNIRILGFITAFYTRGSWSFVLFIFLPNPSSLPHAVSFWLLQLVQTTSCLLTLSLSPLPLFLPSSLLFSLLLSSTHSLSLPFFLFSFYWKGLFISHNISWLWFLSLYFSQLPSHLDPLYFKG